MKLLLALSLRNLWRHKRRNGLLLLAIAVAVGTVTISNTLIRGYQTDLLDAAVTSLTGHVKVHAAGYRDDPSIERGFAIDATFQAQLPRDLPVLGWAPRIRIPAVVMSERETRGVQLVGVNPAAEHISFISGVPLEGRFLSGPDDRQIVIGRELARQLETRLGKRLVIITQGADGLNREQGFRISGIYDAEGVGLEKAFVFAGLDYLQDLLDSNQITEVSVRLAEELDRVSARNHLAGVFAELEVLDWQQLEPQAAVMYGFADTAIYVWFLLMMSALTFGLINTLIAAVMERGQELGMLRALGMSKAAVICQVVLESSLIMLVAVVVGVFLGLGLYAYAADGIDLGEFAEGVEMAGLSTTLVPVLQWRDVVLVVGLSLFLGIIASLYPAWRVVKVKPLDAMRV